MLDKRKEAGERCILAVMTDGLENSSREYTKETIKALLDRKQKEEGWLVLYLGAGHDAWTQARAMGLHAGNVAAFDKQAIGVSMAAIGARSKRYAMCVACPVWGEKLGPALKLGAVRSYCSGTQEIQSWSPNWAVRTRANERCWHSSLDSANDPSIIGFSSASARPYGISGPNLRSLGNAQHWHPDHYEIQE